MSLEEQGPDARPVPLDVIVPDNAITEATDIKGQSLSR